MKISCSRCAISICPIYAVLWYDLREIPCNEVKQVSEDKEYKTTEAQRRAFKTYTAKFDDIRARVPRGDAERFKDYAKAHDMSLSQFVIAAVSEYMENHK